MAEVVVRDGRGHERRRGGGGLERERASSSRGGGEGEEPDPRADVHQDRVRVVRGERPDERIRARGLPWVPNPGLPPPSRGHRGAGFERRPRRRRRVGAEQRRQDVERRFPRRGDRVRRVRVHVRHRVVFVQARELRAEVHEVLLVFFHRVDEQLDVPDDAFFMRGPSLFRFPRPEVVMRDENARVVLRHAVLPGRVRPERDLGQDAHVPRRLRGVRPA